MCLQVLADVTIWHPFADQTDREHGRDTNERNDIGMPEEFPHDCLAMKCLRDGQEPPLNRRKERNAPFGRLRGTPH
jgi:hypothetical protein